MEYLSVKICTAATTELFEGGMATLDPLVSRSLIFSEQSILLTSNSSKEQQQATFTVNIIQVKPKPLLNKPETKE